jgi:tRNA(Arg) A34 adenosine deaminase TadA
VNKEDTFRTGLMRQALALADQATELGEAPIACIIADLDSRKVIGRGFNSSNARRDRTAHAEMVAFQDAAGRYDLESGRLLLVSTLEPCIMCLSACVEAAVEEIVWAHPAPLDAGAPRVEKPSSPEARWPRIIADVLKNESRQRFERWLELHPETGKQRDYIESLLAVT